MCRTRAHEFERRQEQRKTEREEDQPKPETARGACARARCPSLYHRRHRHRHLCGRDRRYGVFGSQKIVNLELYVSATLLSHGWKKWKRRKWEAGRRRGA